MNLKTYLDKMRKIEKNLLDAIYDKENKFNDNYFNKKENFIANPNDEKDFKSFISLIGNISTNHHRSPTFINRIGKILLLFKDDLVNKLTAEEICETFVYNKVIFLFLIKNDIFKIDDSNQELINKYIDTLYFLPEISHDSKNLSDDYFDNREKGENEIQICKMIRADSIDDFIIYVNKNNISLNSTINTSKFETNQLLLTRPPTLIEYASFFGSIQIVKYLHLNNATINGSIWKYSIHSNNDELIYYLLDKQIQPEDQTYQEVFFESIKCFHNEIAHYIKDNLLKDKVNENDEKEDNNEEYNEEEEDEDHYYNRYRTNELEKISFKYNNYEFYPERMSIWSIMFLIDKKESELANLYLESQNISKDFFFNDENYEKIGKNCMKNKQTGKIYEVDMAQCTIKETYIDLLDEAIKTKDFPSILEIKGFGLTDEKVPLYLYNHLENEDLFHYAIKVELTGTQKYILILGITLAMKFLHDNKIILDRLYPGSVLIDHNFYPLVKIPSFIYRDEMMWDYVPPHHPFSSPEVFKAEKISFASNVFTYSLIVYIIITRKHPYLPKRRNDIFKIIEGVCDGFRPDTSEIHSDIIKDFLENCWHQIPDRRLSFDEILEEITKEEFYSYFEPLDHESVKKYLDTFTQEDFKKLKDKF